MVCLRRGQHAELEPAALCEPLRFVSGTPAGDEQRQRRHQRCRHDEDGAQSAAHGDPLLGGDGIAVGRSAGAELSTWKRSAFASRIWRVHGQMSRVSANPSAAIIPSWAGRSHPVTWEAYGQDLEGNLAELLARVHTGRYRAKPARRAYIPKTDGRQRPLGIAALEDKLLQRAVVEVLNAVYEADFVGFSYGFRPGRSPHDALDALAVAIDRKKVSWVLDADIRGLAFIVVGRLGYLARESPRTLLDPVVSIRSC